MHGEGKTVQWDGVEVKGSFRFKLLEEG